MSGEDVQAKAGVAKATATANPVQSEVKRLSPEQGGANYAGPPPGKWDDANRTRSETVRDLRAQARALHADGKTMAQITAAIKRSRRTVEGYLKDD